jgi:hypothetical protein
VGQTCFQLSISRSRHASYTIPGVASKAPKTVIDYFRWRSAVALDVTLETTKEYLKCPDSSLSALMKVARFCGVEKLITPYLEA